MVNFLRCLALLSSMLRTASFSSRIPTSPLLTPSGQLTNFFLMSFISKAALEDVFELEIKQKIEMNFGKNLNVI